MACGNQCGQILAQLLVYGLTDGAVVALSAAGFTLAYAVARQINLAHGSVFALTTVIVANVAVMSSLKKLRSHTFRLRLDYEGSTDDTPDFVVVKMGHVDDAGRPSYANSREIAFYRGVAPAVPTGLVPRCFEVVEATDTSAWHVLLEDLTDSHFIATA